MEYKDFYDLAVYGNEAWKGCFTPKEIACNAYDYLSEYEVSMKKGEPTPVIQELISLLKEDSKQTHEVWSWLWSLSEIGANKAKESKWSDIHIDFFDDIKQAYAVDAWEANMDEGTVIAYVHLDSKEVEYIDPDAKVDPYSQKMIKEFLENGYNLTE